MFLRDVIGQPGDAEPCHCRRGKSGSTVGLESTLWPDCDNLVAIRESPCLSPLHERLMQDDFLDGFGRPVRLDIVRARDELSLDWPDALGDQAGVLKVSASDRAIETLCNQVNEAIAVGGMNVKLRMLACHFSQHRGEVGRTESQWNGNPQTATKAAFGKDRFPGYFDLGAYPGCIVPKRGAGLCQRSAAGGSCKQLDAKFRFESGEPAADNRLGQAQPKRGRRNASRISNFHECQ